MKRRLHAYFKGRVQGVGFRFTTENIARQLGVTGWVKNLRESNVEVVAEAEEDVLQKFLEQINQYFSRYIQDTDTEWLEATGEFHDFGIRF